MQLHTKSGAVIETDDRTCKYALHVQRIVHSCALAVPSSQRLSVLLCTKYTYMRMRISSALHKAAWQFPLHMQRLSGLCSTFMRMRIAQRVVHSCGLAVPLSHAAPATSL